MNLKHLHELRMLLQELAKLLSVAQQSLPHGNCQSHVSKHMQIWFQKWDATDHQLVHSASTANSFI